VKSQSSSRVLESRRVTPYVVSLGVLPGLLTVAPPRHNDTAEPVEYVSASGAVSSVGATLDEWLSRTRSELGSSVDDSFVVFEDTTFELRPHKRTRHRARLIRRNRTLRFADSGAEFEAFD
jgi:hypothetical protein